MGTTSEKLTYLNTTKTLIKEELNLGGANITNEPFRAYKDKLEGIYKDFLANGTDTLWNNWEKVSGTGETITLNNTIEAKMDFVYKGNTSQDGEPTPDTPIPVQVVSGDNEIVVCGKNLFDKSNTNVINGFINASSVIKSSSNDRIIYIPCKANTTYSVQKMLQVTTSKNRFSLGTTEAIPTLETIVSQCYKAGDGTTTTSYTITTKNTSKYLVFFCYSNDTETTFNEMLNSIQIEISDEPTTYEAYKGENYPINIGNIELCKIGTYQDKIYKDNGKWYLNKQIGKVVLDGSENSWGMDTTKDITQVFSLVNGALDKLTSNNSFYSNYFINQAGDTEKISFTSATKNLYLALNKTRASSVNELKNWLSTHNTTAYYVLATPTTTEITDTTLISQLEAIKKSYNNQTNISQTNADKPFILDVVALGELD